MFIPVSWRQVDENVEKAEQIFEELLAQKAYSRFSDKYWKNRIDVVKKYCGFTFNKIKKEVLAKRLAQMEEEVLLCCGTIIRLFGVGYMIAISLFGLRLLVKSLQIGCMMEMKKMSTREF